MLYSPSSFEPCSVITPVSSQISSSSSAKSPTSGKWGKNAKWKLNSKGVLTISGKGTLKIEELSESVARKVKEIKINDGITKVDFSALFFVNDARKVTLNKTITSIDRGVFNYFDNITSVNVPSGNKKYSSVAGVLYSKDKNSVYYASGKIEGADKETFEAFKNGYARDKNHIYLFGKIQEGVNPETFEIPEKASVIIHGTAE